MPGIATGQRYRRPLSNEILIAFHHVCDQRDTEVARALLDTLDFMAARAAGADRRATQSLVAAHERLWQLRHPSGSDDDLAKTPTPLVNSP
jgi:hypothetical protein